jgi:hypothetical protein
MVLDPMCRLRARVRETTSARPESSSWAKKTRQKWT